MHFANEKPYAPRMGDVALSDNHDDAEALLTSSQKARTSGALPDIEAEFYGSYEWCLNPFLTIAETIEHLQEELGKIDPPVEGWKLQEIMTNVFLLSCSLLNSADDYLHGPTYRLPRPVAVLPFSKSALGLAERAALLWRWRRFRRLQHWKLKWQPAFDAFLLRFVQGGQDEPGRLSRIARELTSCLRVPLPEELRREIVRLPSAFRKQDLTHIDFLALGQLFIDRFPDRRQPILVVGLRTAGSYFAPLLRAFLRTEGYQTVSSVTLRPNQALARWERAELARAQSSGSLALLVDEPPVSGRSISMGVEHVRRAGLSSDRMVILAPVRAMSRDWQSHIESIPLHDLCILTLQQEKWHKHCLLGVDAVQGLLQGYFRHQYKRLTVAASASAEEFTVKCQRLTGDLDRARLKRVYAVILEAFDGTVETRYVLAKSVGWGWLAYAAFLTASRLSGLVPPLLGLRDGILYTEWLPQSASIEAVPRSQMIATLAEYVAARVRSLRLAADPISTLGMDSQHAGFELLQKRLCTAYGAARTAKLMSRRIRRMLALNYCPVPTLIDGKMSPTEWVASDGQPLKTDFEQHGFGKHELNIADPAYDLADTILQFELSQTEEQALLQHYVEKSGDDNVKDRLFSNKLMAGSWLMAAALRLLNQPELSDRGAEFNAQYIRAWNFLTLEGMRFSGRFSRPPEHPVWRSPLVVMDLDGVLDSRHFGFPTTTAAGIEALRLLHSHGYAVAIDTARSAREVQNYCKAYGLVGGVAEYGSYVYDAVSNRELRLVTAEALEQLVILREALRRIPGVFVNDDYDYSIRAYTYGPAGTLPLPGLMISNLVSSLGLDRLRWFQTTIDSTICAKEVDKGKGLIALLKLAGQPDLETIAIGDSAPDLPMFRVATNSFAPSHADRRALAEAIGCQVVREPFQRGLLGIVKSLIHPDGARCHSCTRVGIRTSDRDQVYVELLHAADKPAWKSLFGALFSPAIFQIFVVSK